jgi:winged helix DNA-binding protein
LDVGRIVRQRMHNVRVSGDAFDSPTEVVRWLGAVQSQDYGPAKWSIAQRMTEVDDGALDRAFDDGDFLRTHVLRPTWHFVLPEDIRWLLALTGPRVHALNAYAYRRVGLDDDTRRKSGRLLARTLRGGEQRTRKELKVVLERAGIATEGFGLAYILINAELEGIICSGARRGKQHTYALLDERVPPAESMPRDEALGELIRRYFTSHGPATAKDLRWWSSLTLSDITRGVEIAGSQLTHEVIDGVGYWSGTTTSFDEEVSPTVHLLQAYDEYIVGYTESKFVLDPSGGARSLPPGRPMFNHAVILDGRVAGHWKRTLTKGSVAIEAALYEPFDGAATRALQAEADAHGRFLDRSATVITTLL